MKLQTKVNIGILSVFLVLGLSAAYMTYRWQTDYAIKAAENRVRLYIKAAWEIYNAKIERIQATLTVMAEDQRLKRLLRHPDDKALITEVEEQLQAIRVDQNMDILNILDSRGKVILRSRHPASIGDVRTDDPMIAKVLKEQRAWGGTVLLPTERLRAEGEELIELCQLFGGEPTGMMTAAAVPVRDEAGRLIGVIQTGNLLNGSVEKVDRIRDSLFENQEYGGKPIGTATVFMRNLRISTNVLSDDGTRAIGTRASEEVSTRVLSKGLSWTGRALVVNAWYLSQYDPLPDPDGNVIGMLYLGSLEQRYLDQRSRAVFINVGIVFAGMLLAMLVFFLLMRTILSPVERLYLATRRLSSGDLEHRVETVRSSDELGELAASFNHMAEQLLEDQQEIQQSHAELEKANQELRVTNSNYMEMLGFVSHELKAPLGSAVLGVYSIKDGYLGPVSSTQQRILGSVAQSLDYLNEMIKHYLDLSRLEKGELRVNKRAANLCPEVIEPALQGLMAALEDKQMTIQNCVPDPLELFCDPNLLRIVYDNLVSNAIKYGKNGGVVVLGAEIVDGEAILSVLNEGDGIAADKLSFLFQKFSRIENARHAGKKGTGLGLFICKEIVEQHGGRISAESEEGRWTRFNIVLPRGAQLH
jgi:two-component system, NtrC family, sensor kinase